VRVSVRVSVRVGTLTERIIFAGENKTAATLAGGERLEG